MDVSEKFYKPNTNSLKSIFPSPDSSNTLKELLNI